MRLTLITVLVGVLLAVTPSRAADAQEAQRPASPEAAPSVTGRVVDLATRAGIGGVRVELGDRLASAITDPDGAFTLTGVPPGRHLIVAALDGYAPSLPREVVVSFGASVSVEIPYSLVMVTEVKGGDPVMSTADIRTVAASSLAGHQIATMAGGLEDVYRSLQMQPGVAGDQDDRNDLLVRGGGAIENETRIDGFVVPNATHFGAQGGTGGGLGAVPAWSLDQAAIEIGGFSVAHGERASSVVALTVRPGNRTRLAGAAAAGVGGAAGVLEGPLPLGGSFVVSARRSFLELVLGRGDARATPTYGDALLRVDLPVSSRHRLEVLGFGTADKVVATSASDADEQLDDRQHAYFTGLSWQGAWSARTSTLVLASVGSFGIDAEYRDAGRLEFRDQSSETELRVVAEARRRWANDGALLVGAAVKRADLSFELSEDPYRNEYGNLVGAVRVSSDGRLTDTSAYAELTAPRIARIRATAGVRVDRAGTTGRVYGSPRVKGEFQPAANVRLTASWGVFRQAIPYIWIGSHPDNSGLAPVFSRQATAGAELASLAGARLMVEAFDKRYEGYPVDPVAPSRVLVSAAADFESPFVGRLTAAGLVRARGVDLGVTRRVGRWVDVALAYSFWRVSQRGLDGVWRAADYDVRNQVRIDLRVRPGRYWLFGSTWRYADGRPYTPFDVAASIRARGPRYDLNRINAVRYPPYHRLDVRADRVFAFARARLIVYGEVTNVYARDNIYMYEWSTSARRAMPIYQWGLTPVAGVRIEF